MIMDNYYFEIINPSHIHSSMKVPV